jgi:hypothetical protein
MSLDHEAIRKAYPDTIYINDDLGAFKTDGTQITLVQSDIDAARATIDAEYAAQEYARKRAAEYPSVVDQLDKMFHSGFQAWKDEIQKIKDKYPKP